MNRKTLGGCMFVIDGIKYDYCFEESLLCLKDMCDEVVVLDAGSNDGTLEVLKKHEDDKMMIVSLDRSEWDKQKGREKLAYFQNMALSFLGTDYYFLLQADEIVPDKCFPAIRDAMNSPHSDVHLCTRINMWGDCDHYLNVPIYRQPCNTTVARLAKTDRKSYGDGESIEGQASAEHINKIYIVHYGFVRKADVMKAKVMNMQEGVFQINHDPKLDQSDVFDSKLWFSGDDLKKRNFNHPKYIREWVKTRP